MLVSDIARQVGRSFGDTDQVIIANTDMIDWINEAQLEICKKTECIITTTTAVASIFPLTIDVTIPTFIRMKRMLYGALPLVELEITKLDDVQTDLGQRINTPQYYYFNGRTLNLYPLQQSNDATVITLQFVARPPLVSIVGDTPAIPEIYHKELVSYALAKSHERGENQAQYEKKMGEFEKNVNEDVDNEFNRSSSYPIIRDDPYGDW